jgi:hypothetical protein
VVVEVEGQRRKMGTKGERERRKTTKDRGEKRWVCAAILPNMHARLLRGWCHQGHYVKYGLVFLISKGPFRSFYLEEFKFT